jgi:hypothetical protein
VRHATHGARWSLQAHGSIPTSRRLLPFPACAKIDPCLASRSDSVRSRASWIRRPPRHSTTIIARNRSPCRSTGILPMTATIYSTVGGSAGCLIPLFRGGRPALWPGIAAGERRRPAASSNPGEEDIAPSPREQIVDPTALPPQPSRRSRRAATPYGRRDRRPPNRPSSPDSSSSAALRPRPSSYCASREQPSRGTPGARPSHQSRRAPPGYLLVRERRSRAQAGRAQAARPDCLAKRASRRQRRAYCSDSSAQRSDPGRPELLQLMAEESWN